MNIIKTRKEIEENCGIIISVATPPRWTGLAADGC